MLFRSESTEGVEEGAVTAMEEAVVTKEDNLEISIDGMKKKRQTEEIG